MKVRIALCFILIFAFLATYILFHWGRVSDAALVIHMIAYPLSSLFESVVGIAHNPYARVAVICAAGTVQYGILGYLVGVIWDWIEAQVADGDDEA
ncbi:MAG TPA: hypothetical protein VJ961_01015 [Mariprofundaceae bacterium]|nr:hypothetical protein [Mariprofundaceae bacterium]